MNDYEQLKRQVDELQKTIDAMKSATTFPFDIDQAIRGRFANVDLFTLTVPKGGTGATSLTGILRGNNINAIDTITPLNLSGAPTTYYVADSSGGAVTRKLTFSNGILTSET